MDAKDFYGKCLEAATAIVRQVTPDMLANETPDDEWNVRDLVGHMLYEVVWVPDMVTGKTMAEVGGKFEGDLLGDDPKQLSAIWGAAANKTQQAVEAADLDATAHLSYRDTTNKSYLKMTGGDILVHAWDLAKGIGVPISWPADVATDMWQNVKGRDMGGSGLFKPAVKVPDDASDQDKILGLFGRDPAWRPKN